MTKPVPKIGDSVYVPSRPSRGFRGGLCKVSNVSADWSGGDLATFVEVEERPRVKHNWKFLAEEQDELKREFGDRRGGGEAE